jgi:hypothetical protein
MASEAKAAAGESITEEGLSSRFLYTPDALDGVFSSRHEPHDLSPTAPGTPRCPAVAWRLAAVGGVLGFAFVYGGADAVTWMEPQDTFPYMGGLVPIILA